MNAVFYIYIILVILSMLEIVSSDKFIRIFIWVCASCLFIFNIGFGYKIGMDWVQYKDVFEAKTGNDYFEVLYNKLTIFLASYISFWTFVILVKLYYILVLLIIIKKQCKYPTVCITVFFALSYPFINDPLRQLIASSIFLSLLLLYGKYPKMYGIIIATGFHSSALILILGKLRVFSNQSARAIIYSLILAVILGVALENSTLTNLISIISSSASEKLTLYSDSSKVANIFSSLARISILGIGIFLACKQKQVLKGKQLTIYQLAFLMFVIEVASFGLPLFAQRIRLYLLPFSLILLMNGLYQQRSQFRIISTLAILVYAGLSLYLFLGGELGVYYQPEMNLIVQYYQGFPTNNWESNAFQYWIYR